MAFSLVVAQCAGKTAWAQRNVASVSPSDFPENVTTANGILPNALDPSLPHPRDPDLPESYTPPRPTDHSFLLVVNRRFLIPARRHPANQAGYIGLTEPQRSWLSMGQAKAVQVELWKYGPLPTIVTMDTKVEWYNPNKISKDSIPYNDLLGEIDRRHEGLVLSNGQTLLVFVDGSSALRVTIKSVVPTPGTNVSDSGILTPRSKISVSEFVGDIPIIGGPAQESRNAFLREGFSFTELGIGGLDKQFDVILRRAFGSRLLPVETVRKLDITHVRGMILYGPPGTGKTLIARQIGQALDAREPKIVNGPELLNKFVGQSEENVRKIFADAEKESKEKGERSQLHIIIFDELDAICKKRGSGGGGGTGVGDNIVNQLLTKLDGVERLNNILMIGMTNRLDLIDEALLRPGRLELHIDINLPDEHGRLQILEIKTAKLRKEEALDKNVNLKHLASQTKNYSGAELEGLVRGATSFAIHRHTIKDSGKIQVSHSGELLVTVADFERALEESKPMFGNVEKELEQFLSGQLLDYSDRVTNILEEGKRLVQSLRRKTSGAVESMLLFGPSGSGKTALAGKIALDSGIRFVKVITASDLAGMGETQKIHHMVSILLDSDKVAESLIIVDSLEQICDYLPTIPPRFSPSLLSFMRRFYTQEPSGGRKRLIITTASLRAVINDGDLSNAFNPQVPVPNIDSLNMLGKSLMATEILSGAQIKRTLDILNEENGPNISIAIKNVLKAVDQTRDLPEVDQIPTILADKIMNSNLAIKNLEF